MKLRVIERIESDREGGGDVLKDVEATAKEEKYFSFDKWKYRERPCIGVTTFLFLQI